MYFYNILLLIIIKLNIKICSPNCTEINDPTAIKIIDGIYLYNYTINPHPFKYTINPGINFCGKNKGKDVYLLIVVNTNPNNFKYRETIRETWAKRSLFPDVRILFLMGLTNNKTINDRVILESNIYQDILQEDFYDSYRNLTYKGIMSLKWTVKYCLNIKYFIKTDDDVIIDLFTLLNHFKYLDLHKILTKKTILCRYMNRFKFAVHREKSNRWYLSKSEYDLNYFTEYCSS